MKREITIDLREYEELREFRVEGLKNMPFVYTYNSYTGFSYISSVDETIIMQEKKIKKLEMELSKTWFDRIFK